MDNEEMATPKSVKDLVEILEQSAKKNQAPDTEAEELSRTLAAIHYQPEKRDPYED